MRDLVPFLMFCGDQAGKAEEALTFYCSIFPNPEIVAIDRYGPNEDSPEGSVRVATFQIGGRRVKAIDSFAPHQFGFTPAISLWFDCESVEEIDAIAEQLGAGGMALMPLGDYGFSKRFTWIADRFGVTWQLNLAE